MVVGSLHLIVHRSRVFVGLTSTTGFVQVGAAELTGEGVFACVGREASCLFAVIPGETWVKVLMSNLTELGVKTGGLDEEGECED